jgi:uncharacterized membrane protein
MATLADARDATRRSRRPRLPGLAIGVALGGFLDGIVLHQVLQWHHLLSAVERPGLADLRTQVLADGLFHAAMYAIAAVGLWRLARAARGAPLDARRLLGDVLLGFAAWHLADAVLSHWLLGIHRIRMDTDWPLAWDLGWLAVFGGLPAIAGARLVGARGPSPPPSGPGARPDGGSGPAGTAARVGAHRASRRIAVAWIGVTSLAGLVAARPPAAPDDGSLRVTVVLRSAVDAPRMLATAGTDTRIVGTDRAGTVWQLRLDPSVRPLALYRHGAVWVAGALSGAGCAAWVDSET